MTRLLMLTAIVIAALSCSVGLCEEVATEKPFYMGVYMYEAAIQRVADNENDSLANVLDTHFEILARHGLNLVHWAVEKPENFDTVVKLARKYDLKLLGQLNFVYFRSTWDSERMDKMAAMAAEFLNKYVDEPQVLAWSVKEELVDKDVSKYEDYCTRILTMAPDTQFCLVGHHAGPLKNVSKGLNFQIIGSIYYYFGWWREHLNSPQQALFQTWDVTARLFAPYARMHPQADFMLVVTQGGYTQRRLAQRLIDTSAPDLREALMDLAERGVSGWRVFEVNGEKKYNVWRGYRLPGNCLKATAWIGVLEGARLICAWSYAPFDEARHLTVEQAAKSKRREAAYITLGGRPGDPNPQLAEYAQAAKEIKAYGRIITRMHKLNWRHVETATENTRATGFSFPEMNGQIAVIFNGNVGEWPYQDHREFQYEDDIRIDDQGNLVGYKPYTEPTTVRFSVNTENPATAVTDIATGKTLTRDENGEYTIPIDPGSGRLVFIGSSEDANKLHSLMQ